MKRLIEYGHPSILKIGICLPNYGQSSSADAIKTIALDAERLGFDSIWCTDHILMSRNSGTPYEKIVDSITTLGYAAGITSKVKLGISSLITPMRNPIIVAKQLATIDNLSGGRLILVTSPGWNEKEYSNLSSDFKTRGKRLDASIRLIRSLWEGKRQYKSRTLGVNLEDAVFDPLPVQTRVPIWIGGNSRHAMERVVRLGDGWHPNLFPLDRFKQMVQEYRSLSAATPKPITVRVGMNPNSEKSNYLSPQGEKRVMLSKDEQENKKLLRELDELGVEHVIVAPSTDGKASISDQKRAMEMIIQAREG